MYFLLANAILLALSATTTMTQGIVLLDNEPVGGGISSCAKQVAAFCPLQDMENDDDQSAIQQGAGQLLCLAQNRAVLGAGEDCFFSAAKEALSPLSAKKSSCSKELDKRCGKAIDELEKQIEERSAMGVIRAMRVVVQCVAENAEELWEKCKPKKPSLAECERQALALCPATEDSVLGFGYTVACLHDAVNAGEIDRACADDRVMGALGLAQRAECWPALQAACGNEISQFERERSPSVVMAIPRCMSANANALWNACKLQIQEEEAGKTPKPTSKPTKRKFEEGEEMDMEEYYLNLAAGKTPKPTNKPTKRKFDEEMEEDDYVMSIEAKKTPKPTSKPTKRKFEEGEEMIEYYLDLAAGKTPKPTSKPTKRKFEEGEEDIFLSNAKPTNKPTKKHHQHHQHEMHINQEAFAAFQAEQQGVVTELAFIPDLEDGAKKTKSPTKPTRRPTAKKHIYEELSLIPEEFEGDEENQVMVGDSATVQITSIQLDLDACVNIARRLCAAEVAQLSAHPNDEANVRAMGECVDRNLDRIETECSFSTTTTSWMGTAQEDSWMGFTPHGMMSTEHHAPCKHHAGEVGNLPLCAPKHRCGGHMRAFHHKHVAVGMAVSLLSLIVLVALMRICLVRVCASSRNETGDVVEPKQVDDLECGKEGEQPLLKAEEKI